MGLGHRRVLGVDFRRRAAFDAAVGNHLDGLDHGLVGLKARVSVPDTVDKFNNEEHSFTFLSRIVTKDIDRRLLRFADGQQVIQDEAILSHSDRSWERKIRREREREAGAGGE